MCSYYKYRLSTMFPYFSLVHYLSFSSLSDSGKEWPIRAVSTQKIMRNKYEWLEVAWFKKTLVIKRSLPNFYSISWGLNAYFNLLNLSYLLSLLSMVQSILKLFIRIIYIFQVVEEMNKSFVTNRLSGEPALCYGLESDMSFLTPGKI
jgi:hypothetical protein